MVLKYDPNLESYIYIENPLEVLASAIHRSAHSASGGYSCRIKQAYSRTHVVCIAEKSTSEVSGIADNIPHIYSIRTIKQGSNHIELQSSPNHRSLHWQVTRRRRSTSTLTIPTTSVFARGDPIQQQRRSPRRSVTGLFVCSFAWGFAGCMSCSLR